MIITKSSIAEQLIAYLHHAISHQALVAWAENVLMEGEFDPSDSAIIRDSLARIGVSDVRVFGITWEDCEEMLHRLGYTVHISVKAA